MTDYEIPPELVDYVLSEADKWKREVDQPSNTWLFQANPSIYDVDSALSELAEISWVVRQHAKSVKKGDRVYLWRSGANGGVVATATVASEVNAAAEPNLTYVLKPESLSKPEPRVTLHIDSVLTSVIRRTELIGLPVLGDLQVIKQANGTNYRVTPAQDAALQVLLTGLEHHEQLRVSDDLAERLYLPVEWLQEAVDLLTEKGQVVFYGPPGTGKTFVAMALADEITKDGGETRVVQFHPSYAYEDFVGGFRPVEDGGEFGVKYRRTNGPLREIAALAAADPSHPHVLIIDEINRGNIPKIFGELLFLLEYRAKEVRLPLWPELPFSLPKNLHVIGTMNTADRSIALVDAALRRRFYFVEFAPTQEPVKSVLGKWLKSHELDDTPARLLNILNAAIAKDELSIGPSYFMGDEESGPDVERVWSRAIMPLLEEYYFGMAWDKQQFALGTLRARLAPEPIVADAMPSDLHEAA
jgi:MoxR-like ATPase